MACQSRKAPTKVLSQDYGPLTSTPCHGITFFARSIPEYCHIHDWTPLLSIQSGTSGRSCRMLLQDG
jgi:hypothetical protein